MVSLVFQPLLYLPGIYVNLPEGIHQQWWNEPIKHGGLILGRSRDEVCHGELVNPRYMMGSPLEMCYIANWKITRFWRGKFNYKWPKPG